MDFLRMPQSYTEALAGMRPKTGKPHLMPNGSLSPAKTPPSGTNQGLRVGNGHQLTKSMAELHFFGDGLIHFLAPPTVCPPPIHSDGRNNNNIDRVDHFLLSQGWKVKVVSSKPVKYLVQTSSNPEIIVQAKHGAAHGSCGSGFFSLRRRALNFRHKLSRLSRGANDFHCCQFFA